MYFKNIKEARETFKNKFEADFTEFEKLSKKYDVEFINVKIENNILTLEIDFEKVLNRSLTQYELKELKSKKQKTYLIITDIPCFVKKRKKMDEYTQLLRTLEFDYNLIDEVYYSLLNDFDRNIKSFDECIQLAKQNHIKY